MQLYFDIRLTVAEPIFFYLFIFAIFLDTGFYTANIVQGSELGKLWDFVVTELKFGRFFANLQISMAYLAPLSIHILT